MDPTTEAPIPSQLSLYPIVPQVIDQTMEEIYNKPQETLDEDVRIVQSSQPHLSILLTTEPASSTTLDPELYSLGFHRAFRFFRNQAIDQNQDLPLITQEYITALLQSRNEDKNATANSTYIKFESTLSGRLGAEIRTQYPEFYDAINRIAQFQPSILRGMIDVVFIFQHYQKTQNLEKQLKDS